MEDFPPDGRAESEIVFVFAKFTRSISALPQGGIFIFFTLTQLLTYMDPLSKKVLIL